jgi:hypothetical protein
MNLRSCAYILPLSLAVASTTWAGPGQGTGSAPKAEASGAAKAHADQLRKYEQLKADQAKAGIGPLESSPARSPLPDLLTPGTNRIAAGSPEYEIQGVIAGFDDGALMVDQPLTAEDQALWAKVKKAPITLAPKAIRARIRIDGASVSTSSLERRVGETVRLKLRKDSAGVTFVTDVQPVK